jgi:phospholipase C
MTAGAAGGPGQLDLARQKVKHVIVIMQENRSFDHYFGTFPGADGIPTSGTLIDVMGYHTEAEQPRS